jgi:glycosyltransferase involved in cell wall biosynthesis
MPPYSQPRLGYLVSQYPGISHTFILREVLGLQRLGFGIEPASVNLPDRPVERLTSDERTEAARTYYIKEQGAAGAAGAMLTRFLRAPGRFFSTLLCALRLGGSDLRKLGYQVFYFVEACLLAEWMRSKRLSHLHVHFATPASMVGLLATRLEGATLSITVHGPDEFYDAAGYRLTEKIEACAFLCAISHYARSQLMKLSGPAQWDKIEISPLGVEVELFTPRPVREIPGQFEILCVGRLVSAKGQHILLRAAELLAAQGRDFLLRFVGDGPDRESLEREAGRPALAGRVRFEGSVDQEHIRELYATAGAFALASFAEGIPVVLMEAMAMEIPCVTTWITGIPELIENGEDGLLVAPSDVEGLAAALERLMDDAPLRRRLGESARRRVDEHYNLRKNLVRLGAILERRLCAKAAD